MDDETTTWYQPGKDFKHLTINITGGPVKTIVTGLTQDQHRTAPAQLETEAVPDTTIQWYFKNLLTSMNTLLCAMPRACRILNL